MGNGCPLGCRRRCTVAAHRADNLRRSQGRSRTPTGRPLQALTAFSLSITIHDAPDTKSALPGHGSFYRTRFLEIAEDVGALLSVLGFGDHSVGMQLVELGQAFEDAQHKPPSSGRPSTRVPANDS